MMNPARASYQVICVCGGYGYPLGTASAARITMVGKSLQAAGIGFRLLHCGPSPLDANIERSGIYEGIPFKYTTSARRPRNRIARLLVYLWGVIGLTADLRRLRAIRLSALVYLYIMDGPLNFYVGCLCRILGLPVVQELCEWFPGEPTCSSFTKWLHNGAMFKSASGVLVISTAIKERVAERAAEVNPNLPVYRVPVLVDARQFADAPPNADLGSDPVPHFSYCGTWVRDIHFCIRALQLVQRRGFPCRLEIVGSLAGERDGILAYGLENGLSPEDIVFTGYVAELGRTYRAATALLMPLHLDDRSITRLPNKLGEYLAAGRPVISSKVGDLMTLLTDGIDAYLAQPGDEQDFAAKMMAVLQDPVRADQIGKAGQRTCQARLDYRAHASGLADFFVTCLEHRRIARRSRASVSRCHTLFRNCFCGLIALGVIASGRLRRARERALRGDVVTAIYFHNPNRRLFDRCIRWLKKNEYVFISTNDLLAILHGQMTPPKGAVWLSFDDGFKEFIEHVLPVVRQHRLPVTLFVPSGIIEGDGLFPWLHDKTVARSSGADTKIFTTDRDSITVADLKRIATYPEVTIGSHTVSHAVTTNFTPDEAGFEFGDSKQKLEAWTGKKIECFAYPEGRFDGRESALLARLGYRLAATTETALITRETNPYLLPRFCVSDEISFPEAICNMAGVWRPAIDAVIELWSKWGGSRASAPSGAGGPTSRPDGKEQPVQQNIFASHASYYEKRS